VSLWQDRTGVRVRSFEESVRLFRTMGDLPSEARVLCALALAYLGEQPPDLDRAETSGRQALAIVEGRTPTVASMARVTIGRALFARGDPTAAARLFDEALTLAEGAGDMFACTLALTNRGWAAIALGEPRTDMFERNLRLATRLGDVDGAAYALEGMIAVAVVQGDMERAGVLTGAAEAVRLLTGMGEQASFVTYQPFVASALESEAAPLFEAARARGRAMTVGEATGFALAVRPEQDDHIPGGSA
jgi:ATP/maltotriose-dependent transcriptional regulator MalT